ncbi:Uncharacterised protein [Dermatophilus congolensis]|uniref:Uncharacterized protein n=1 Tax=Dermatophilus congolensis TaxID=1863 RepID=A0AA46BMA2_9MICO|nr:Uncharacterised protein [Dermatophilus congolensis]
MSRVGLAAWHGRGSHVLDGFHLHPGQRGSEVGSNLLELLSPSRVSCYDYHAHVPEFPTCAVLLAQPEQA